MLKVTKLWIFVNTWKMATGKVSNTILNKKIQHCHFLSVIPRFNMKNIKEFYRIYRNTS